MGISVKQAELKALLRGLLEGISSEEKKEFRVTKKYDAKVNVRISIEDYNFLKEQNISISLILRSLIHQMREESKSKENANNIAPPRSAVDELLNRLLR